jgi:hypothetical protein
MPKRTALLVPGVAIVLAHALPAASALIEIPRATLESGHRESGIHQLEGPVKGTHQVISIDRRNNMPPLLTAKAVTLDREDFLWTALGHSDLVFVQSSQRSSDGRVRRTGAGGSSDNELPKDGANRAPESSAIEIWTAILIVVGLIWSQARRKSRQRPIRFTAP